MSIIPKLVNVLKIAEEKLAEKKGKETSRKRLVSIMVKLAIGRRTARPTWNPRRRWHVMLHHLLVFMSF